MVTLVFLGQGAARGDDLQAVEDAIIKLTSQISGYQLKSTVIQSLDIPEIKMENRAESTVETAKRGDTWLYRAEGRSRMKLTTPQNIEQNSENYSLTIAEGDTQWSYSESDGKKGANKIKLDTPMTVVPDQSFFARWHERYDMRLLPEEVLDGQPVFVLEAKAREAMGPNPVTVINYFDKQSGMVMKTVGKDINDNVIHTSIITDLKLNVPIDPERFKFKAPEGVPIMDMSGSEYDELKGFADEADHDHHDHGPDHHHDQEATESNKSAVPVPAEPGKPADSDAPSTPADAAKPASQSGQSGESKPSP